MTKTIWTATCSALVIGTAIAVMAQTPTPQPNTQTPAPQPNTQTPAPQPNTPTAMPQPNSSASMDRHVTVTGCLRQEAANNAATDTATGGAATTAGTSGTSGAPATDGAGSPAEAKFVLADAKISPDAGAASTTASGPNSAQTYRLIANPAALTPHVGKKLELTGTIMDQASAPSGSADANGPALKVESGKVIAAACQQ